MTAHLKEAEIFISWSGKLSKNLATILHEFIPNIIQHASPFLSSEDIRKGKRWSFEIAEKLQEHNFGIICLTYENYEEPWILFEAGALSSKIMEASVCTILFDEIDPSDLYESPLSQFQHTKFTKPDFHQLFKNINEISGSKQLSEKQLEKSFNAWWPKLQKKLSDALTNQSAYTNPMLKLLKGEKPISKILRLTEHISSAVSRLSLPRESIDFAKFGNNEWNELTYLGETYNLPVRVRIFPFSKDGTLKHLTITKFGETIVDFDAHHHFYRGVSIEILFYQEIERFFSVTFSFHKGQTNIETNQSPSLSQREKDDLTLNPIWRC